MRSVTRVVLAVLAAIATLLALTACGQEKEAGGAQSGMPPPVAAHSDDVSAPVKLTVQGAAAEVATVDTDTDGVLLPPTDINEVGWWVGSALPGSGKGTVVVTGHVDDVSQGKGFAARFPGLKSGDTVSLTTAGHGQHDYRVTRVDEVNKNGGLPTDQLNRLDGPETLALVTCGGPFVGPPLGYQDNIVVWASPA
ncbi:MAG: class F sortase [Gordonia sp. (in: high G+C Gram-positive bacteria)]|uniref:class F sortase n=1 Tax=Gordonia sp. (in: high G+C Gram-positive bacteria) TaxID=84139 RepID=UPI0039E46EAF